MSVAVISTDPPAAVIRVFPNDLANINIPDKWSVTGGAGYSTPDGKYKIVPVTPFVVPVGKKTSGAPTYAVAVDLASVTQTFPVQDIPPLTVIPWQTFLARLTDAEYIAIKRAIATQITAGNATVARWYDRVSTAGGIVTTDPSTATVKAAAVTASLLTQQRADIVFAP
jgi:hypothetical protein